MCQALPDGYAELKIYAKVSSKVKMDKDITLTNSQISFYDSHAATNTLSTSIFVLIIFLLKNPLYFFSFHEILPIY